MHFFLFYKKQRLILESWFTKLEREPLNRSVKLPTPYNRLVNQNFLPDRLFGSSHFYFVWLLTLPSLQSFHVERGTMAAILDLRKTNPHPMPDLFRWGHENAQMPHMVGP